MASVRAERARGEVRYRVRFRDVDGAQRERTFTRKADAAAYAASVEHAKAQGETVALRRRPVNFEAYAAEWMAAQAHRPGTVEQYTSHLRLHIVPTFGRRPLGAIRPTDVQGWVTGLSRGDAPLAPRTVGTVYKVFASILRGAVRDGLLSRTPCDRVTLPEVTRTEVRLLDALQVAALADAMPARWRAMVLVAAGTGLRQGEAFGLCLSRIDWLRRTVTVDQQVTSGTGRAPALTAPKSKASRRVVPAADHVLTALSAHVAEFGPEEVLFTTPSGSLLRRSHYNDTLRCAALAADLPAGVTFHDLRHAFASWTLADGIPISDVSKWLGHASITETVDTYGHLLPESGDRLRAVVNARLRTDADQMLTSGAR